MRPYLAMSLFALAIVVAACGGGGGASTPGLPPQSPSGSTPISYARAAFTLRIPAQPKSGAARRPAYVSPNTQSVQVYAFPLTTATPSASPSPPGAQIFPVTTPSPCTQAADGSKTCTFNVQAPIGEDEFVVLTYAEASPGPTSVPLAIFNSGAVNVTNGGTPPTLTFALSGVVTDVSVSLASPLPSISPQTQIAQAGVAFSPMPLSITPRDQSGSPIVTDSFVDPITLSIMPVNAGVTLALARASQCSPASTIGNSGTTATITCAKDLTNVTYAYNGAVVYNASAVVDRVSIGAQPETNSTPQPAQIALEGNVVSYVLPAAGLSGNVNPVKIEHEMDGSIRYLAAQQGVASALGSFTPSNPASSTAVPLPYYASGFATDNFGNIWVADHLSTQNTPDTAINCYTALSSTPAAPAVTPMSSAGPITPFQLARDGNGNIWYFGQDPNTYNNEAGYLTVGPNCSLVSQSTPVVIGSLSDYPQGVVSDATSGSTAGVWLLSQPNGNLFHVTTATSGSVSTPTVASGGTFYGDGLAADTLGNVYASEFNGGGGDSVVDQLPAGGSSLNTATVTSDSVPGDIDLFPFAGYPSRVVYSDANNVGNTIGLFDPKPPYSTTNLQILPLDAKYIYSPFFDSNGDAWAIYTDYADGTTLKVAHLIRTSVWMPVAASSVPSSLSKIAIGIAETGESGPFTVTNISDPTVATAATPWPGIDHDVLLNLTHVVPTAPLVVTISDARGRSQTVSFNVFLSAGARHRNDSAKIPCVRGHRLDSRHSAC